MNTVEVCQIDLSYESCRLRDRSRENSLLSSIAERGIMECLQGVLKHDGDGKFLLLDGFKRYRCARKLGIEALPYISIGDDAASGILQLIRTSNDFSLHLLEQARLVTDLHKQHHMSGAQIAAQLERSPAWVGMRLGLLGEMSAVVKKEIFSGGFPARSFMYTLRQFTRVHKVPAKDVDEFVGAVSGKGLSGRNVDQLARAYFQGGENFREQIVKGNFGWTLDKLKQMDEPRGAGSSQMNEQEKAILRDLEVAHKYEGRIIRGSMSEGRENNAFFAEVELLTGGIQRQLDTYSDAIGRLHDRCREAKRSMDVAQAAKEQKGNRATARTQPKDGQGDHQESRPTANQCP